MSIRIKCAIEGCKRTSGGEPGQQWICSVHWRRYCPPRSRRRRAYLAFFRKAKRFGWDADLRERFWRFWETLVRNANAKEAGGAIDKAEISRLFGWDQ